MVLQHFVIVKKFHEKTEANYMSIYLSTLSNILPHVFGSQPLPIPYRVETLSFASNSNSW